MRVLWVTNMWPDEQRPWYGSFVFSQAQSLLALGHDIDVLYIPGYRSKSEYARAVPELNRRLRAGEHDLVHAHYGHSAAVARAQARVPVVISYCGDDLLGTPAAGGRGMTRSSLIQASAFAQLARGARRTITKSEEMARHLPRATRSRNRVIPNGVDLARFGPGDRRAAREQLGWSDRLPNVLFMGSLQMTRKNLSLAREMAAELERRGAPIELRVAADVEPDLVPVWMNASDVLLFPSLSEGSPNAVKEAMACELPIVSAPVGDVPERLHGVEGTFVVARDAGAMADAITAALRFERAPAARAALADLSLERVAERIADVYREALG